MQLAGRQRCGPDREGPLGIQDNPGSGPDRRRKPGLLGRGIQGASVGVTAAGRLVVRTTRFRAAFTTVEQEAVENGKRASARAQQQEQAGRKEAGNQPTKHDQNNSLCLREREFARARLDPDRVTLLKPCLLRLDRNVILQLVLNQPLERPRTVDRITWQGFPAPAGRRRWSEALPPGGGPALQPEE